MTRAIMGDSIKRARVIAFGLAGSEKHPRYQAEKSDKENQQKTAQRQSHDAVLFGAWPGDAEGCNKTLHQEVQHFHDGQYRALRLLVPLSAMSDDKKHEDLPDPARAALDQPHLSSAELENEIGDAEPWDEGSEENFPEDAEDEVEG